MFRSSLLLFLFSFSALAGDLTGVKEVSVFGGVTKRINGTGADGSFGGNVGYGLNPKTMVFVELTTNAGGRDYFDLHAGVKQSLTTHGRFEPYILGGVGWAHLGNSIFGSNAFSLNGGFGSRVYVGAHWGVQPEFRWLHFFANNSPDMDLFRSAGGLFFQW